MFRSWRMNILCFAVFRARRHTLLLAYNSTSSLGQNLFQLSIQFFPIAEGTTGFMRRIPAYAGSRAFTRFALLLITRAPCAPRRNEKAFYGERIKDCNPCFGWAWKKRRILRCARPFVIRTKGFFVHREIFLYRKNCYHGNYIYLGGRSHVPSLGWLCIERIGVFFFARKLWWEITLITFRWMLLLVSAQPVAL